MESPDEVLAVTRVDAGLAADGRIHLREQRRRDLHETHAPAHDGRREAGKVADDASAQGDDEIAALDAGRQHGVADMRQALVAFRRLARRHHDHGAADAALREARDQPVGIERGDRLVRHDDAAAGAQGRDQRAGLGEEPRRSGCRRRARRAEPGHGSRHRAPRRGESLVIAAHPPRRAGRGGRSSVFDDALVRRVPRFDGDVGQGIDWMPGRHQATHAVFRVGVLEERPVRALAHPAHEHLEPALSQIETPASAIQARVSACMKAPPPVASTIGPSCRRRPMTRRSPSRK